MGFLAACPAAVTRAPAESLAPAAGAPYQGRVRVVLQRVSEASVAVEGRTIARIGAGALLLVGVERGDGEADADALARKVAALRWFPGRTPMDRTLAEAGGACLVVSQFTLLADLARGNRPGFADAEEPAQAERLVARLMAGLAAAGLLVEGGRFGARMAVALVNDGPVTFCLAARGGRLGS